VGNWARLGLVTVSYEEEFLSPEMYTWVEKRPEFSREVSKNPSDEIVFKKKELCELQRLESVSAMLFANDWGRKHS
jgi:hypothetical protein